MRHFSTVFIVLIILCALISCEKDSLQPAPGVLTDPIAPPPEEDLTPSANTIFYKVGDILTAGDGCVVEGTDATFTVLERGTGSFISTSGFLYEGTDDIYINGGSLDDNIYYFSAKRLHETSWKIERLDPDDFD